MQARIPKGPGGVKTGQGDPCNSDATYDQDEFEFIKEMDRYRNESGHRFPTLKETLQVIRSLGYRKDPHTPLRIVRHPGGMPLGINFKPKNRSGPAFGIKVKHRYG